MGTLWVKAGHEVMFSSLDLEHDRKLAASIGPGARIVRAYNEVSYARMREDAHRAGERLGIPLAGDDAEAVPTAVRLVRDAGHEPVVVGGLARAREFDCGTPVFGRPMTAAELRQALGVKP
jgi:predicted dinucleotide-binding enzyme